MDSKLGSNAILSTVNLLESESDPPVIVTIMIVNLAARSSTEPGCLPLHPQLKQSLSYILHRMLLGLGEMGLLLQCTKTSGA